MKYFLQYSLFDNLTLMLLRTEWHRLNKNQRIFVKTFQII